MFREHHRVNRVSNVCHFMLYVALLRKKQSENHRTVFYVEHLRILLQRCFERHLENSAKAGNNMQKCLRGSESMTDAGREVKLQCGLNVGRQVLLANI